MTNMRLEIVCLRRYRRMSRSIVWNTCSSDSSVHFCNSELPSKMPLSTSLSVTVSCNLTHSQTFSMTNEIFSLPSEQAMWHSPRESLPQYGWEPQHRSLRQVVTNDILMTSEARAFLPHHRSWRTHNRYYHWRHGCWTASQPLASFTTRAAAPA